MQVLQPVGNNLVPIGQIIFHRPSIPFFLIRGDSGRDMSFGKPLPRHPPLNLNEPNLVHEGGGVTPGFLSESDVISFKNEDAVRGFNGDVVVDRVLFCVVEGRGIDCFCRAGWGEGEWFLLA